RYGAQTANHAKPCRNGLAQQAAAGIDHGFLLQGNPDIRRVALEGFAEESGGSDADYGHGMAFDDERGAYDGRIRSIGGLPDTVAEDGDRRCGGLVVLRSKDPAAESANSQG